jgi:photosystem II stability/assembly factor-like uncharacterized protein
MIRAILPLLIAVLPAAAQMQITMQDSHSKAGLRGIHSLENGVAWASGSGGTVLRTTDGGATWQACATPAGGEKLDFRAIQAFDANTAVAMSAGTGDLSRVYRTSDACRTWKLVLSNPDSQGFFDALRFSGPGLGVVIGDPVDGAFPVFLTEDGGNTWRRPDPKGLRAEGKNQALFAASNSSLAIENGSILVLTGGGIASLIRQDLQFARPPVYTHLALASGESAGGFSLAVEGTGSGRVAIAVGGDYKAPAESNGTAVVCAPACEPARTPPHGYRSAVAYDSGSKVWIAVGTNGGDVSSDSGRTWRPLEIGQNWNALSLPFVVGSGGRIGKLDFASIH